MTPAHQTFKKNGRYYLATLLAAFLLCAGAPTFADSAQVGAAFEAEETLDMIGIDSAAQNGLDDTQLGDIRGRYAPPGTLESDNPIAVILWDEGTAPQTGSSGSHQQANGYNNHQRTTLQTSSTR